MHSDIVAERAAALGVSHDGRADTEPAQSGVGSAPRGWVTDTNAVGTLVAALYPVMPERVEATAEADPVSHDIFISITADLGKHHWMFQAANG